MKQNLGLIEDDRLTPTMTRVRSGRTQVFREKGAKDEIKIQHEDRHIYAELIDGKWYWLNGCAECNGEPRDWMTYLECETHDRCSKCSTNRKDIKGTPWGGKKGWTCAACVEKQTNEARAKAFEEFNKANFDKYDFMHNDFIKCPHCGTKLNHEEIYEDQQMECHVCDGQIEVEVQHTLTYSTSIIGEKITS